MFDVAMLSALAVRYACARGGLSCDYAPRSRAIGRWPIRTVIFIFTE